MFLFTLEIGTKFSYFEFRIYLLTFHFQVISGGIVSMKKCAEDVKGNDHITKNF